MAKTKKRNPNKNSLKKEAVKLLKKQTGWDNVTISLIENRILDSGENVLNFTGHHPKQSKLPPVSILLNMEAKEVKLPNSNQETTTPVTADNELIKSLDRKLNCEQYAEIIDAHLSNICANKFNTLEHCDEDKNCPCATNLGQSPKVDLIILIDTSGSMSDAGKNISDAAEIALSNIVCPTDLRITWLGIAGTFADSKFEITSRCYLEKFGTCTTFTTPLPGGTYPDCKDTTIDLSDPSLYAVPPEDKEEGARTIIDLCNCFDWRPGACRSIFYISDEPIHRGTTPPADEVTFQTGLAIEAAIANNVTIFTHYIKNPTGGTIPSDEQNYIDICQETEGQEFISLSTSVEQYINLLNEAICNACGGCKSVELPQIKPCISISWGDSDCDCMETNDLEVLCISVCNCFENVTFENVVIGHIYVVDKDGNPVPNLPDGTPSVELLPIGPICFGNIGPCTEKQASCVSRQVILRSRGAIIGNYALKLGNICYRVSHSIKEEMCFNFELCKD